MNRADMQRRVQRLDELLRGFAREVALWRTGNDPLLFLERRAYVKAMQDALAGVEAARVVLVKACHRLESNASAPPRAYNDG